MILVGSCDLRHLTLVYGIITRSLYIVAFKTVGSIAPFKDIHLGEAFALISWVYAFVLHGIGSPICATLEMLRSLAKHHTVLLAL